MSWGRQGNAHSKCFIIIGISMECKVKNVRYVAGIAFNMSIREPVCHFRIVLTEAFSSLYHSSANQRWITTSKLTCSSSFFASKLYIFIGLQLLTRLLTFCANIKCLGSYKKQKSRQKVIPTALSFATPKRDYLALLPTASFIRKFSTAM